MVDHNACAHAVDYARFPQPPRHCNCSTVGAGRENDTAYSKPPSNRAADANTTTAFAASCPYDMPLLTSSTALNIYHTNYIKYVQRC